MLSSFFAALEDALWWRELDRCGLSTKAERYIGTLLMGNHQEIFEDRSLFTVEKS